MALQATTDELPLSRLPQAPMKIERLGRNAEDAHAANTVVAAQPSSCPSIVVNSTGGLKLNDSASPEYESVVKFPSRYQ